MGRRSLTYKNKKTIGLKCCNCGEMHDLQYHHIVPIAIGGKDINSNMCCLCYDCHYKSHHEGKKSITQNFGELIKEGQVRAKAEGRFVGQQANEVTVMKNNGQKYVGTTEQLSKIFKKSQRTIEDWCRRGVSDRVTRNLGIKTAYYNKVKHPGTKPKYNNITKIEIKIYSNKIINVNNQLAFF